MRISRKELAILDQPRARPGASGFIYDSGTWQVFVPGDPVPQGRPRFGRGRVWDPARSRTWKERIALHARSLGVRVTTELVALGLEFWLGDGAMRGDLDNFTKAVLDALAGVAYVDDRQVVTIHAELYGARSARDAGVGICLQPLERPGLESRRCPRKRPGKRP